MLCPVEISDNPPNTNFAKRYLWTFISALHSENERIGELGAEWRPQILSLVGKLGRERELWLSIDTPPERFSLNVFTYCCSILILNNIAVITSMYFLVQPEARVLYVYPRLRATSKLVDASTVHNLITERICKEQQCRAGCMD